MNALIGNPGWFPSNLAAVGFTAFIWVWIVTELINRLVSHTNSNRKNQRDRGSQAAILLSFFISIALSFYLRYLNAGIFVGIVQYFGLALGFAGIALREWAVIALGKHFTVKVEKREAGRLVKNGPYRFIRHPSYTGAGMALIGLSLAIGVWAGVLIAVALPIPAYVYRVNVEEKELVESFGGEYSEYKKKTWGMIPGF